MVSVVARWANGVARATLDSNVVSRCGEVQFWMPSGLALQYGGHYGS